MNFDILPFLLAILPFTATQAYAAKPIICLPELTPSMRPPSASSAYQTFMNKHVNDTGFGITGVTYRCHFAGKSKAGESKMSPGVISFLGIGPDVHVANSRVIINCPLVRKSKLVAGANFYGARATAVVGGGVDVGVFANKRFGVCVVTGLDVGVGGGVAFEQMSIEGQIQY